MIIYFQIASYDYLKRIIYSVCYLIYIATWFFIYNIYIIIHIIYTHHWGIAPEETQQQMALQRHSIVILVNIVLLKVWGSSTLYPFIFWLVVWDACENTSCNHGIGQVCCYWCQYTWQGIWICAIILWWCNHVCTYFVLIIQPYNCINILLCNLKMM